MPAVTLSASQRTHRHSTPATCPVGRCSFSGPRPQVIKHEVHEHLLRRFFCCACDKTLSSFESLRTHANSQHFRNRLFKCETCGTTYLDPARLAKCRKRHRGQFRCPELGCGYHNARKNSVVRHMKTQHHRVADEEAIPFDNLLSCLDPPKMRRVGSSSASSVSSLPGAVDSLLGIPSQGPSDDELFRLSEEKRRVMMELTRKEHVLWMGGEDALKAAVPDYPAWSQRDHPYGRAPSLEPESGKNEDDTDSSASPTTPELVVSSPEVDTWPGSTTLKNWAPQAAHTLTTASASSGLLVPSDTLLLPTSSPRAAASASASPAWFSGSHHAYSDSILPSLTTSTLPFPLPSPGFAPDPLSVPALESSTLFSPHHEASLSSSPPSQPWHSPITPRGDHFYTSPPLDHNANSYGSSQYADDSPTSSQDSLFPASPNPTFGFLATTHQVQLFQDAKSEYSGHSIFQEWFEVPSET